MLKKLGEKYGKRGEMLSAGRTFSCVRDRSQISGPRTKEVGATLRATSKDRVRWTTLLEIQSRNIPSDRNCSLQF